MNSASCPTHARGRSKRYRERDEERLHLQRHSVLRARHDRVAQESEDGVGQLHVHEAQVDKHLTCDSHVLLHQSLHELHSKHLQQTHNNSSSSSSNIDIKTKILTSTTTKPRNNKKSNKQRQRQRQQQQKQCHKIDTCMRTANNSSALVEGSRCKHKTQ